MVRASSFERCCSSLLRLLMALQRSPLQIDKASLLETFGILKLTNFGYTASCLRLLRKSMSNFSFFFLYYSFSYLWKSLTVAFPYFLAISLQIFISFVLSRKIINIYNDIARKYGNVTVKDFQKYKKLEYKKKKLKLDIDFLKIANNLVCIQNLLSLNCRMFLTKTLYQFVKDSFVVPTISAIKNRNFFQKNSV